MFSDYSYGYINDLFIHMVPLIIGQYLRTRYCIGTIKVNNLQDTSKMTGTHYIRLYEYQLAPINRHVARVFMGFFSKHIYTYLYIN